MWNNPNGYTHSILNANLFNSDLEKLPSIVCPVYSLDEEKTIDHCILRNIYDELDANHIFYIDIHCKDSIEDPWQLVASEKLINTRNYTQEISFSPKAAKYWSFCFRLSSHPYSSLYGRNNREIPHLYQYDYPSNLTYNKISLDKAIIFGNSKEYDFRKVGLNFKTPPQESTEILLNATLDIPYKDDQIIMYETCETRVFGPKNNVAN